VPLARSADYHSRRNPWKEGESMSDSQGDRAQRIALGAAMAKLGGGHTKDTVPDDTTPYRTEDGGWSTKALDAYLDQAAPDGDEPEQ
jgi:hypothetical protein